MKQTRFIFRQTSNAAAMKQLFTLSFNHIHSFPFMQPFFCTGLKFSVILKMQLSSRACSNRSGTPENTVYENR